MAQSDDIKQMIDQIVRQEQALIFPSFDENEAFALGHRIRDIAVNEKLGIAIEISLWDRQLFYATTAGSTGTIRNGCAASSTSCVAFMHLPTASFWNRIAKTACSRPTRR